MKKFNKDTCVYKVCIGEVKMTSKEMYITSCIGLTQV